MAISFTPIMTTQRAISNPTLSSGTAAGKVFDGLGDDFLDPDKILKDVDNFSKSVKPETSNTWTSQLVPSVIYSRTDDPSRILKNTNSTINSILSPNFGKNLNYTVPIFPGPFYQPVPDLGSNPDPTRITLSTLFFTQNIQSPNPIYNPNNYNPLLWQNPNSTNILLGTQQAQNNILNGLGLMPPFTPFSVLG
ncbi:MAG TPA: hypothetical protein V6C99_03150 [Oculatellaceae cyanobacterium]|jgi:hypothetical protein